MKQNKVKTFVTESHYSLDFQINNWIEENPHVFIVDMKFSVDKGGLHPFHVLLWYTEDME